MMALISRQAPSGSLLTNEEILEIIHQALQGRFAAQRVLVLIPDHTRTLPLPFLFRTTVDALRDVRQLDFMVALGTHPPLSEAQLQNLTGITTYERQTVFRHIRLFNHAWDDPNALKTVGVLPKDQIKQIAGERWHPSLAVAPGKGGQSSQGGDVPVRINKTIFNYDHLLVLGPTFPHEVVGFSGGAKYLFPGISGPEMINTTHWLGALSGVVGTIGIRETPVRGVIDAAMEKISLPVTLLALVVEGDGLGGIFIGDHQEAWRAAADLSAQRHIRWVEKPFQRVLSCAPPMYDELWTAAKAMYKLEPAVATGGEVVIYAPHLDTVSHVHGKYIDEVGYHTLGYFLQDWERYKHIPLGVLAHSTHVRGSGVMVGGVEKPNVRVTLASQISAEHCQRLNLGYLDPREIDIKEWQDREGEGIQVVPKAGEILFRLI